METNIFVGTGTQILRMRLLVGLPCYLPLNPTNFISVMVEQTFPEFKKLMLDFLIQTLLSSIQEKCFSHHHQIDSFVKCLYFSRIPNIFKIQNKELGFLCLPFFKKKIASINNSNKTILSLIPFLKNLSYVSQFCAMCTIKISPESIINYLGIRFLLA